MSIPSASLKKATAWADRSWISSGDDGEVLDMDVTYNFEDKSIRQGRRHYSWASLTWNPVGYFSRFVRAQAWQEVEGP